MNPQTAKETIKKLTPAEALKAFVGLHPLSYTVTAKFDDDHITAAPNLSSQTSIASAIERYKKNQNILLSSWILLDENTLKNKASGATKVPCVHNGAQQMAVAIKVKRRTVTISAFTRQELKGDNPAKYTKVTIGTTDRYLTCKSEEKEVTLSVKGPYNPLTGAVQLYHYEEAAMPAPAFVERFLKWVVGTDGHLIRPEATK